GSSGAGGFLGSGGAGHGVLTAFSAVNPALPDAPSPLTRHCRRQKLGRRSSPCQVRGFSTGFSGSPPLFSHCGFFARARDAGCRIVGLAAR
ncbi:hypothetical protein ACFU6I_19690, partial [Streptomyces sp. NPDC057486]|uniref:hypothetical protein n=1 Tax=Streptomyces sp. NPDC057486 TaxID=3346145 RepID=UPI003684D31F